MSFRVHVAPALVEVYAVPPCDDVVTATSLVPSAEEATEDQFVIGAVVVVHVVPESIEV